MEGIIMVAQLLLGLTILVGLHEMGHMLAARAFGMKVEKYAIGFPPKIWSKQIGETEYSFGAIPLGGFVKIAGMIDESLDTKSLSEEPQPYEFRAKPAWQRLIVMLGGIIVNVITGIIIFICLAFVNGETFITKDELNKNGIVAYDLGEQMGFEPGDKIISVNGKDFSQFKDVVGMDALFNSDGYYTVERGGKEVRIDIPKGFLNKLADKKNRGRLIAPRFTFTVGKVREGSEAAKIGLKPKDRIVSVNADESVKYFDRLRAVLKENKEKEVELVVNRGGQQMNLKASVPEDAILGFQPESDLNLVTRKFGFGEALSKGTYDAFAVVWLNIKGFKKIFSGELDAKKSLSGPIGIAKSFGGVWIWTKFWTLVGMLSMILAFMNLLPIPALDGGHVVFLTWEIITGRKPSDKFLENAQKVGMILVLGLMVFAIVNDLVNW